METTSTNAATPVLGGANTSAASTAQKAAGDFQTFLTLLTTQMRNQDPLKPIDSTEFIAQLASFSSVEQQIKTNEHLDHISNLLVGGTTSGLSDWIGRDIRREGVLDFTGESFTLETSVAESAQSAELVVRDLAGNVVAQTAISPANDQFVWNAGDAPLGGLTTAGRYQVSVLNTLADGSQFELTADSIVSVDTAQIDGNDILLGLSDGTTMSVPTGSNEI